jgi:putative ABC transport system permease protein
MQALNRKLMRDLFHLRGQAAAVALIVACGIASFVTMLSAYQSLELSQATYYERYRFAQVFAQLKRAPQSLSARIEAIPGVAQVRTRVVVDVTLDVPGLDEPASGRLISIPERRRPMLNDLFLRRGRYISSAHSDEVLVSEAFAEANALKLGDRLGAVINGRWEQLRIVGVALSPEYVYEIQGAGTIFPDNKRFGVLWMGRKALATAFDMDGAFNDVALSLLPRADEAEAIARLDVLLERYGGLGAYERYQQVSNRFLSDEITSLKGTATIVPTIFLGIAAFLLHVVLSRLVTTQREQIAVLKAFGYTNVAIGWHYLKLILVIVLLGATLGIVVGLWFGSAVTENYARFFRFPLLRYEAGLGLLITAVLVSSGAAILGAITAVRRAVALPPAEGMRPEPPAHFRPTVVERIGLQSFLSPVGRMILRNLERKPVQALLSILGIALAVAIIILGRYFVDALERIVEVQFYHVQREDVSIVFHEPRSARARYEVAHLPGVLHTEPFRSVPVRLRFGHRMRRSVLTGLDPAGEYRRVVDRHLRTVDLPPSGLVLTKKLAELLDVVPGQRLGVEVLEGARPVRQVPVVELVDELVGVSAYMDIRALNRLMREGRTISGAYLAVDQQQAPQLYALLKRMPAIAGVSLRQAALTSFEDTVAASLGIFTSVLVVFACIIACGVVYNAARIALSERGRELASLRVMGFTRTEIAIILLGEQALLTLAAIPVGFALGWGFSALMPLAFAYTSELYRLPVVVNRTSYAFALVVVMTAACLSGLVVRRRLDRLDLIAVLKTRE